MGGEGCVEGQEKLLWMGYFLDDLLGALGIHPALAHTPDTAVSWITLIPRKPDKVYINIIYECKDFARTRGVCCSSAGGIPQQGVSPNALQRPQP